MSQTSLSTLQREINEEIELVKGIESDLIGIERAIFNAMSDSVGARAEKSIKSICHCFSSTMEVGLTNASNTLHMVTKGYNEIDCSLEQGKNLLSQAHCIVNNLGDI